MNAGTLSSRQSWMLGDSYSLDLWSLIVSTKGMSVSGQPWCRVRKGKHQTTRRRSKKTRFLRIQQEWLRLTHAFFVRLPLAIWPGAVVVVCIAVCSSGAVYLEFFWLGPSEFWIGHWATSDWTWKFLDPSISAVPTLLVGSLVSFRWHPHTQVYLAHDPVQQGHICVVNVALSFSFVLLLPD